MELDYYEVYGSELLKCKGDIQSKIWTQIEKELDVNHLKKEADNLNLSDQESVFKKEHYNDILTSIKGLETAFLALHQFAVNLCDEDDDALEDYKLLKTYTGYFASHVSAIKKPGLFLKKMGYETANYTDEYELDKIPSNIKEVAFEMFLYYCYYVKVRRMLSEVNEVCKNGGYREDAKEIAYRIYSENIGTNFAPEFIPKYCEVYRHAQREKDLGYTKNGELDKFAANVTSTALYGSRDNADQGRQIPKIYENSETEVRNETKKNPAAYSSYHHQQSHQFIEPFINHSSTFPEQETVPIAQEMRRPATNILNPQIPNTMIATIPVDEANLGFSQPNHQQHQQQTTSFNQQIIQPQYSLQQQQQVLQHQQYPPQHQQYPPQHQQYPPQHQQYPPQHQQYPLQHQQQQQQYQQTQQQHYIHQQQQQQYQQTQQQHYIHQQQQRQPFQQQNPTYPQQQQPYQQQNPTYPQHQPMYTEPSIQQQKSKPYSY